MARIGLLFDQTAAEQRWRFGSNCFSRYLGEILSHRGIPFEWLTDIRQIAVRQPDVLIVVLAEERKETVSRLWDYAERGGTVISYGGLKAMSGRLGCRPSAPIGIGYAYLKEPGERNEPLRFLDAFPWIVTTGDAAVEQEGAIHSGSPLGLCAGSLYQRFRIGTGAVERWAVNIADTVVRMQQGPEPVLEDGIPAPDGSANVVDGILKADDMIAFDWELDRMTTDTGAGYFALPHADLWREALIRQLILTVLAKELTIPFIGFWPNGVEHVALISHDSDHNQDEQAEATLALLAEEGIRSTWCMLEPGYSAGIYPRVEAGGHELAFHYNALEADDGKWEKEEFQRQLDWLRSAADLQTVTSNKNHYTRFEGWGELFEWCEQYGIVADQTRGPSKKGNVGFLFGTCHPYFPIAGWDNQNRLYDVLELGFLTQDMDVGMWADSSVIIPFLSEVQKVGGVAHFLFHQTHIHRYENVRSAFRKLVQAAREAGFEFWTSREINEWQRSRRTATITGFNERGEVDVQNAVRDTVVWIPVIPTESAYSHSVIEYRFGIPCRRQVIG